jgi:hypothetical protein
VRFFSAVRERWIAAVSMLLIAPGLKTMAVAVVSDGTVL